MQFHYILYAIWLLVKKQKKPFYEIIKMVFLSVNSMINITSATEKWSINYANRSHSTTAAMPATFDYDPTLVPESAEILFALRIKQANIGEPFILNMSGNYILKFTKDRVDVLDTYTKNNELYKYQTTNPNITIVMGITKGLPRNYKSIIIKEDANGKLYDYAALNISNISTDEVILRQTLSSPFYQITGHDEVEDKVTISKAMAFYRKLSSHSRHARCVNTKKDSIIKDLINLFSPGPLVCGPEARTDIMVANNASADDLRLERQLVEADFNEKKYPDTVGFRLKKIWDFNRLNALAYRVASLTCNISIESMLEKHRQKRDLPDQCWQWVIEVITLFMGLNLNFDDLSRIIRYVRNGYSLPQNLFPHSRYPDGSDKARADLSRIISQHIDDAYLVLETALGQLSQSMIGQRILLNAASGNYPPPTQEVINSIAAGARLGRYSLARRNFIPLDKDVIKQLDSKLEKKEVNGDIETKSIHTAKNKNVTKTALQEYINTLKEWIEEINKKMKNATFLEILELRRALNIAKTMLDFLERELLSEKSNIIVNAIYHGQNVIGISFGVIDSGVYQSFYELVEPGSILQRAGAYRGAIAYLRSEVLRGLFGDGLVHHAEILRFYLHAVRSHLSFGFEYIPSHDEL